MSLHDVLLVAHSGLRWVVLAAGATALGRAVIGMRSERAWTGTDTRVLRTFVGALDLQVLIGLVMYFGTSALGVRMLRFAGEAMHSSVLRFFAVEHLVGMIAAVIILHVGAARGRRLGESPARHRRTALVVGVALALVLVSIPWPFFPYGRPLLRVAP